MESCMALKQFFAPIKGLAAHSAVPIFSLAAAGFALLSLAMYQCCDV